MQRHSTPNIFWLLFSISLLCSLPCSSAGQDCNNNGIPDGCDVGCGTAGSPCDVEGCGQSSDCNSDGTPDECENLPPVTIDAVHRGWWRDDGFHNGNNNNTFVGQDGTGTERTNTYFIFDVSGLANVGTASLHLDIQGYFGPDPFEMVSVYSVTTDAATLEASGTDVSIYNDLQSGPLYGTFRVTRTDVGTILEIPLNPVAIADINASTSFFSVGLHAPDIGLPFGDEGVRFSLSNEVRIHQLVVGGFRDCNANGQLDDCDVQTGSSLDCNTNGTPDECETDCNTNGAPDDCDTLGGTSLDCNSDSVPDECQSDCNGNSIPDDCDIADATSPDCNTNGTPDECDVSSGMSPDCNENGRPDECDLADSTSLDCNTDGLPDECQLGDNDCNANHNPDECDVSFGLSDDCNSNGVPDECDADCDSDGTPDECDLFGGGKPDCNTNGVPDECDLISDPSLDCDGNGTIDACGDPDCNSNGIADSCDIASGTSQDCQTDGMPDECQLSSTFSADSGMLIPMDFNNPQSLTILSPPMTREPVALTIQASGDLSSSNEYIDVSVNGTLLSRIFETGATDCPVVPNTAIVSIPTATFNAAASTGSVVIRMAPSSGVTPGTCVNSFVRATVQFVSDEFTDCDSNNTPDTCDIASDPTLDCNDNGVFDACELIDCNSNGVHDSCDISAGSSPDCNMNGTPDECDLDGGLSPDPVAIAFFFDTAYVDDFTEALQLRNALAARGHTVTTFVGVTTASWTAALQNADTLVIPELDAGNLFASLSPGAIDAIELFVAEGGQYLQAYARELSTIDLGLLNTSFGASLVTCDSFGGPLNLDVTAAAGTPFESGPASLSASNETNSLTVSQLPAGAKAVYSNGTRTTLATWTYGSGRVTWLGFDFFLSPTPGEWIEVADRAVRGPAARDCNTNGIPDECDVESGTSSDCDSNGTPDECQPDCNTNGTADACDIAGGTSQDCNANRTPDECELLSNDCNTNGIPDDCETDCNSNRIPDDCDLATGTFADCNADGIPDECQIVSDQTETFDGQMFTTEPAVVWTNPSSAPGWFFNPTSFALPGVVLQSVDIGDSQSTGVSATFDFGPTGGSVGFSWAVQSESCCDGLLFDIDGTTLLTQRGVVSGTNTYFVSPGVHTVRWRYSKDGSASTGADAAAIDNVLFVTSGTSGDCNENGTLDACDITADPSIDCNTDGLIDTCGDRDCNSNNIPDVCDVAAGTSPDCNSNGTLDECETGSGPVVGAANIAFFFDSAYVDEVFEARQLRDVLMGRGHTVTTFTGTTGATWSAALADADVLVIPELDGANLFSALDTGARNAISEFVVEGGTFIQAYARASSTTDIGLLNGLFGATLTTVDSFGGPMNQNIAAASGTPFEGGPPSLPAPDDTNSLSIARLPIGTKAIYSDGSRTTLATWPFGSGRVVWLGFDYFQTPTAPEWIEVADRAARITVAADCNSNGIPDECDVSGGASMDCDTNGVPDECEIDCNVNGVTDACDLSSGTSSDCNSNEIPDECDIADGNEVDCDLNGVPDDCEADCNTNGIVDGCDISSGASSDCQFDGVPDECQLIGSVSFSSGPLSPIDSANPVNFNIPSLLRASGDVTLAFEASADLAATSEYISVSINGTPVGRVFEIGALDCPTTPNLATLIVPAAIFNGAVSGGSANFLMTASPEVNPGICSNPYVAVEVNYVSIVKDCNSNGVPDECDISANPAIDCNENGTIDTCGEVDCNSNGVPDECEISNGTTADCNSNGTPDTCEDASTITLNAVDRGWWDDTGFHAANNNNTFTGRGAATGPFSNSYFIFDLSGVTAASAATLRLEVESYWGTSPSESVAVYDVSTDPKLLEADGFDPQAFMDLQTGNKYATFTVVPGNVPGVVEIPLNTQAIADIRASGGLFAIGLHVASIDLPTGAEGVRFSSGNETRTHQLVILSDPDCNDNTIPDACELVGNDCNGNLFPDECDIAGGFSKDCDANGTPDSCEYSENDCNVNGIPDVCDIAAGTSQDINTNGIPDECEVDVQVELVIRKSLAGPDAASALPASEDSILPGSTFFVEMWASDRGSLNTGLVGAFVDLHFAPERITAIEVQHRPPFTLLSGGTIDNSTGTIFVLGGNDSTFACPGNEPQWVRVAAVECFALPDFCLHGVADFSLTPSPNEISACGRGAIDPAFQRLGTSTVFADVNCVYDRTGDGFVNAGDLGIFAGSWLTGSGEPDFDPRNDFDCSGFVAAGDLGWFASGWLRSCDALTHGDLPPCRRCGDASEFLRLAAGFDAFEMMVGRMGDANDQRAATAAFGPDQVRLVWRVVRELTMVETSVDPIVQSSGSMIRNGDPMYLELWVRDETVGSLGMTAVYLDVNYNPAQVSVGEIRHGAIFNMLISGTTHDRRVDRVGGATLERLIAVAQWTRVAVIPMHAVSDLTRGPSLSVQPSVDGVSAVGRGTITIEQSNGNPDPPRQRRMERQ